MINNNKILTVSYGTFSCTLEGFDDSFGTMKAIAEYFRDLAADDRYFGAEPPQPDAQMLARIAQREISRHVDARQDEGRIVLSARSADAVETTAIEDQRAAETPAAEAPAEAPAQAVADAAPAEDVTTEAPAAETTADTPAKDDAAEAPVAEDAAEETVEAPAEEAAAKATVSAEAPAPVAAPAPKVARTAVKVAVKRPVAATPIAAATVANAPAKGLTAPDAPDVDIVPSLPDDQVEAFFSDADTAPTAAEEEPAAVAPAVVKPFQPSSPGVTSETIAEKLKRIRAVVSQQNDADEGADYLEDEHADAPAAAPEATDAADDAAAPADAQAQADVVSETVRDIEQAFDADDLEYEADSDDDDGDDLAAILNRLEADTDDDASDEFDAHLEDEDDDEDALSGSILASLDEDEEDFTADSADDEADAPVAEDDDELSRNILSSLTDDDDTQAEDATETQNYFDEDAPAEAEAEEEAEVEPEVAETPAPAAPKVEVTPAQTAPAPAKPRQVRTRVLKVKRATLEAAINAGQLEEYDDEDDSAEADSTPAAASNVPLADRSTLSKEAEEELARELAELEQELAEDNAQDAAAEPAKAEVPAEIRSDIPAPAEDDLSRLMDEAKHQMDEPENATRRDAFAHLRAAVAAKKADDAVGGGTDTEKSDEPYRDDLASVVRPRRPVATAQRTERPAEPRPAPLKLVAEQRIDVEKPVNQGPVRPRRVATVVADPVEASAADGNGFAAYAEDVGAESLPELLEAAAAYLSFVEGQQQFSRPQLMTKVRLVEKEGFTREDGLRYFGKLLREGKIEKIAGGRFQASEEINFKPEARAAS